MGERKRDKLLSCVKTSDQFCQYFDSLKTESNATFGKFDSGNGKEYVASISEVLQELNHKQSTNLWTDLSKLCLNALKNISSAIEKDDEENNVMEVEEDNSMNVLESVSTLLLALAKIEEPYITKESLQCIQVLHGSLFDLYDINPVLASAIYSVCVIWTKNKLTSYEELCLNAITLLLRDYLQHGNRNNKFSAICSMQRCLTLFDFKRKTATVQGADHHETSQQEQYNESIVEELRELLIRCFRHGDFLREDSGRKFLSSVLLLHKDLMNDIHQSLMDVIQHKFPVYEAEALGNIYFLSWRSAEEDTKEAIEEVCIQDLMFRTVHVPCAKDQNSFLPLRAMLFSIVCHKTSLEVRHMITRLYSPILWRALKANHSMVRANACRLLLDAFPMEDSPIEDDVTTRPRQAETEKFMQEQYDALNNMLIDNCPRIRDIGITGLGEVLHMYWDAIPAQAIAILVRKIYNDLAFDASAEVRLAVFKTTITLLNAPFAHPLLAKLLPPCLEKCLHDVNQKVRIAVADVLLAVKQTSTIAFWSVCPIQNIIAQLEIDGMPVSKRLIKLLFRSFIPEDEPVEVWVERCVKFFSRNINAARKFYRIAEKDLSVEEIGEFINIIGVFIYNCVTKSLQQNNAGNESELSSENGSMNLDSTQLENTSIDTPVLCGLLETSCILWKSMDHRAKSREMMKKIMITYSRTIHVCFKIANDERTLNALLLFSTHLPPGSLPVFSKSILPKLRSLPDEAPYSYYAMLIRCVCSWDWTKRLLELIADWLTEATKEFENFETTECENSESSSVSEDTDTTLTSRRSARLSRSSAQKENRFETTDKTAAKKKKKKKVVMFSIEEQKLRPEQALKYLTAFLRVQSDLSFSAFNKEPCINILYSICTTLEKCQLEISKRIPLSTRSKESSWSDGLLVEAACCRFQLMSAVYLHQKNTKTDDSEELTQQSIPIKQFQSTIEWFSEILKAHQTNSKVDVNSSIVSNEATSTTLLSRLSFFRQLFNSTLNAFLDYLSCGIEVFDEVEHVLLQFCSSDMNFVEYVTVILKILLQLHENNVLTIFSKTEESDHTLTDENQENDNKENVKLIQIFDHLIATLLQYAKQNSDSFRQLFKDDIKQPLRTLVKEQHTAFCVRPEEVWYDVLIRKSISAVLANLFQDMRASQHTIAQNRIIDLPSFSACVLPIICATSREMAYVCESVIIPMSKEKSTDSEEEYEQMLQVFALLMNVLAQDGKNKAIGESCIEIMQQDVPGFATALSILKTKQTANNSTQDDCVEADPTENSNEKEEILLLENPGEEDDMFMNDEQFIS